MDHPDFIEVFPDVLAPEACAALVARFEASGQAQPGLTVAGHNPAHKDSRDLTITGRPEWADADDMLNRAMFGGLLRYLRLYPQVLLSTFAMQDRDGPEPDAPLRLMRPDDFARYDNRTLTDLARNVPHSGRMRIVERFRLADPDTMTIETTITDPGVLTAPFTSTRTLRRHRDWTIAEYICEENNRNFMDATGKAGVNLTLPGATKK